MEKVSRMSSHSREIAERASVVAGATLLSRILGFVRDMIIAFALGAGPLADAFFVAFRIPNLLRRLFAEGSLTMAFVPIFARAREEQGLEEAFTFTRSALAWLLIVLGLLVAGGLAAARGITWLIAPGFTEDPALFDFTVRLLRICLPYILFISAVALCMGFLNALGHFLAPALAPCVLNVALIAAALIAVWSEAGVAVYLSGGVLVGGLGQWLLQQPFLRRQGFSWRGSWSLRNREVIRMGWLMLPTVLGAAVYQLSIIINTMLASFLAKGSISYLYYADRLVQFPLGVFGLAVSTAALPSFSKLAARRENEEFVRTLNASLGLTLFISLPAAAGLMGLAVPLVQTLFGRGAFGAVSVEATALALAGYAIGLPAFSCVRNLVSAYYALKDSRTPVIVASVSLMVNVALGLALMQLLAHVGLALAVSLASWANILLLAFLLRRRLSPWFEWRTGYPAMVGLSLAVGLGSWATSAWGWPALLCIPLWAGGYLGTAFWLRMPEARMIADMIRRR
jgi:putative peptidoglycan lipid II flippase